MTACSSTLLRPLLRFKPHSLVAFCGLVLLLSLRAASAQEPLHVRIDALLESGLSGPPVALTSDHEFLRRIHLDLTGRIPTSAHVREFLADPTPDKRAKVIDRLLASPQFVRHIAVCLDVMLMERRPDKYVPTAEWRQYLYDSVASNKPLNVLYGEILAADGADPALRPASKFLLEREVEPNLLTRDVGRIVFGMDMQCAQCHDHPLIADYEQSEYFGLFAFYQRSSLFLDTKDNNKAYIGEIAEGDASFRSVFTQAEGKTLPRLPGGDEIEDAVLAKDDAYLVKPDKEVRGVPKYSRRKRLADEVARGDNHLFRKNVANRLWAHMMGRGLVDPVDLHHDENPPFHPALLDLLAHELGAANFDLRTFLREVALTRAYQRSIELPTDWRSISVFAQAQLPILEAELTAAEAARNAALQRAAETGAAAGGKSQELAPVRAAWREKQIIVAEAEKAARDAEAARAATLQQLDAKRPIAQSLAEALAATQRASELLPGEATLTDATAKLQAQADKIAADLAALEAARPAQQQAADAAVSSLATARQTLQTAQTEWEQVSAPLRDLQAQVNAATDHLRTAENRFLLVQRRLATTRELITGEPIFASATAARDHLAAIGAQRAALQQQIAAAEQQLVAQQTGAIAELSTAQVTPASLDSLKQQLEQLSIAHEAALAASNSANAAEEELKAKLEDAWIREAAAAPLKPLTPEQLAWSMMQATGLLQRQEAASLAEIQQKPDAPSDPAALAIAVEKDVYAKLEGNVAEFVRLFGGGAGQPQNVFFATVDQALFFANGGHLASWLAPSGDNLTDRLMKIEDPAALSDELYLCVLGRAPTVDEANIVRQTLEAQPQDKANVVQQLAWALLTSAEFRFSP